MLLLSNNWVCYLYHSRVFIIFNIDIWKIENFQGLEKLEKLQLDNNII